jgi:hypothetical protein
MVVTQRRQGEGALTHSLTHSLAHSNDSNDSDRGKRMKLITYVIVRGVLPATARPVLA